MASKEQSKSNEFWTGVAIIAAIGAVAVGLDVLDQ